MPETSSYGVIIALSRDIIIWCDNCSGQNKNWYLFASLPRVMNDNSNPFLHSVTLKYLETGHTLLSCDSFHGLVERNMRKRGFIYNLHDLVSTVQTTEGGPKILELEVSDFREWDKRVTAGKTLAVPKLKNILVVKFEKKIPNFFSSRSVTQIQISGRSTFS
ncbi:U-box domain-containing protein 16 [Plakobranchus ocellatus]|uniref:U-box domain-containing protein 16 n=1 Tax=Plakobranchus ocellatus TaxID=259542 RepID=A0AAV4CI52_9GAST|nr:U-box domain-containing protein 16 [Plakobranchus ocellatus]